VSRYFTDFRKNCAQNHFRWLRPFVQSVPIGIGNERLKKMAEAGKRTKRRKHRLQKARRATKRRQPQWKIELREIEEISSRYADLESEGWTQFADIPLSRCTHGGLKSAGYVTPTEIQRAAMPHALKGRDILGAAKTGSGKTLAFLVPVLEGLWRERWSPLDGMGALIISPTRELAYQTFEVLRRVGQQHNLSAALIIGGRDVKLEQERIQSTNIVICTPGRLLQHMDETPNFNCSSLKFLVLDEADRILDLGFEKTMNAIIENLPPERQSLLFSATQTKSVRDLARLSLVDPEYVAVHEHSKSSTPHKLTQSYIVSELPDKLSILYSFIRTGYLKMFHNPDDCLKYGRPAEQPQQAKVFKIAHLLALYSACHVKKDAYTLRGWTYILLSCALFLRKSEAAALAIQHLDVPTDSVTGDILLEQGLPRFVYVTIQRSKTDQQGEGIIFVV